MTADEDEGSSRLDDRPFEAVYMATGWYPSLVALGLAGALLITFSYEVLSGFWGAFFAGVLTMHLAIALTGLVVRRRWNTESNPLQDSRPEKL